MRNSTATPKRRAARRWTVACGASSRYDDQLIDDYLYSRVSTAVQLDGMGIDRQDNALTQFLARHPELVLRGTFKDLGISARYGENKLKGEFGDFLKMVESGKVKRGSYLVVESLDRISREGEYEAQATF